MAVGRSSLDTMAAMLGRYALELAAAALAIFFLATRRVTPGAAWQSIDFDLLFVLFALLVAVEILRSAGWLDHLVAKSVGRFHTTRAFGAALIAFTGVLAMLVTNDVALFVVIPFTVIAGRFSDFDVEDAVVLEVIASNLIGCLTPLGNPQNLFVFHRSGWSAAQFVATMAPFVAWCVLGLIAALFLLGRSRPMAQTGVTLPRRDDRAAAAGAFVFVLVLLDIARVLPAWIAAAAALVIGLAVLRRRMTEVDYSILPLFLFAFIVVEGLRSFAFGFGEAIYPTSIALSQVISNVPATVLLAPFTNDWRALLYGVSAGGCGTIIASLANLLGWRIYVRESNRDSRFFRRLSAINVAFLAWAATGGWLLLQR
jgi:Na+/H+ antiporter NhaD/arsenite permease-like protein